MSASRPLPAPDAPASLEPLTPDQRAAIDTWRAGGCVDSPQVAVLRKRARGEALTLDEVALLDRPGRKPEGPTVPHAHVMAELEARRVRGA